jgi:hypothetical protein
LVETIPFGNGERFFAQYKNKYILLEDLTDKIICSMYDKSGNLLNEITMKYRENPYYKTYDFDNSPLFVVNDSLYIKMQFDYSIYTLSNDSIKAKYTLDFKQHNMRPDFRIKNIDNMNIMSEVIKQISENKVMLVESIIQCNHWVISYIIAGNLDNGTVFYSLQNKKCYSLRQMGDILECFDNRLNTDNEYLIATIQSHYCETFKNLQKQGAPLDAYSRKILDFDTDEEDNPILCFIKLK